MQLIHFSKMHSCEMNIYIYCAHDVFQLIRVLMQNTFQAGAPA